MTTAESSPCDPPHPSAKPLQQVLPLAPVLPAATKDKDAGDLLQRLKAMTTTSNVAATTTTSTVEDDTSNTMGEGNGLARQMSNSSDDSTTSSQRRPSTPRSQTDPSNDTFPAHSPRPRNRSPYSRSHLRSHSSSAAPSAPPMTRAHSLPTVTPSGHLALSPSPIPLNRPSSPLRSPKRTRSPFRLAEESYIHSGAPSVCDISEDAELDLTPRAGSGLGLAAPIYSSPLATAAPLPRPNRRRPVSPLHHMSMVPFGSANSSPAVRTPTSTPNSPLLPAQKFNEPFPGLSSNYPSSLTSSSVPSTPTSMRSRSPSISSLETIEDTPDEEAEAIEADRLAKLRAAVEGESDSEESGRRSSLDVPGERRTFGKRDARKRWSVCGAERRGDLDLETIWED